MRALTSLALVALTGCSGGTDNCSERTFGGGLLTLDVSGDLGGSASVDGMTTSADGARLIDPVDDGAEYRLLASIPDPGWALFPEGSSAMVEVEIHLGRDPIRAPVIRVEWIGDEDARAYVTVSDAPEIAWAEVHAGSLTISDSPWESCTGATCTPSEPVTTTVTWAFDAEPVDEIIGCD
ncbi:MAG: hypothetical protein EP330_22320 [Deltaproteobacteria bacterium]|nr:MAG: hypothetical protein EP330_22320 [Deltaproteobacteria bacterium]